MKATNYEALLGVLHISYLLPSPPHIQIIFCLRPLQQIEQKAIFLNF